MWTFKRKPVHWTCEECGAVFERPKNWEDAQWGRLCYTHRQPAKRRAIKDRELLLWATNNLSKIEALREADKSGQQERDARRAIVALRDLGSR